ncbi:MAG: hypothetical protein LIO44_06225 [Eubacterium sp.]|nr:hypothetical protein [Eubacterium sp.]
MVLLIYSYEVYPFLKWVMVAAQIISLIMGLLECFAGFKVMKFITALFGVGLGIAIGVSIGVAADNTGVMIIAVLLFGAGLGFAAYTLYKIFVFLLVFVLVCGAAYLLTDIAVVAVILGIAAAAAAVFLIKPVVIITTAIGGASSVVTVLMSFFETVPAQHRLIYTLLLLAFAAAGMFVQYVTNTKNPWDLNSFKKMFTINIGNKAAEEEQFSFSERKYPGLQRAYRNYCINCGCELSASEADESCPVCGFKIED